MPEHVVDVAICGAGPVGAACALFLLERGIDPSRIALFDARPRDAAAADDRMFAVSQGSATLLGRLGAWDTVARHATAIDTIHVSHRGRFGQTRIDRRDYGTPALGYVLRHGDLNDALDALLSSRGLAPRRPWRVDDVAVDGDALRVTMTSPERAGSTATLVARHVVHAEGGLFDAQRQRAIHRDYGQVAATTFVTTVERPTDALAHTAFERFTEHGPIALLPAVDDGPDGKRRDGWSLVWCGRPDETAARMALDDAAFLAALHDAFGDRLGRFATVGRRRAYPLGLNAVAAIARARSATAAEFAIGNAAQTLHPVAGQGLNLGLRDAHDLAAVLATHGSIGASRAGAAHARDAASTGPASTGPASAAHAPTVPASNAGVGSASTAMPATASSATAAALVARYAAARRVDRAATVDLTDVMPRVFASRLVPVAIARGLTLALLDVVPPLRGLFARQMMNGRR